MRFFICRKHFAAVQAIGVTTGIAPVVVDQNGQAVQTQFATGGGGGTVGQVEATAPVTVTPTTPDAGTYTVGLAASGVAAGSFGDGSHVAQLTVDAFGRITAAANVAISAGIDLPGTQLVFRPGGAAAPGVFTTWAAIEAAQLLVIGVVEIVFDSTFAPCVVSGATAFGQPLVKWTGNGLIPTHADVTFAVGATVSFPANGVWVISGMVLENTSTAPVVVLEDTFTIFLNVSNVASSNTGPAAPLFSFATASASVFIVGDTASGVGNSVSPVITVDASAALVVALFAESNLTAFAITGAGANGGNIVATFDSSSAIASTAGVGPTLQIPVSQAVLTFYLDSSPLLGTSTVQGAIDALKGRAAGDPIVATIAALGSLAAGGFAVGQKAIVDSNLSLWAKVPPATATVDGITCINATPSGQWLRSTSLGAVAFLAQTAWFIDPAAGNDEANGLTIGTAIKTKAELYRRWGNTWAPKLDGIDVVITYVTGDTTDDDAGFFAPNIVNGATLTHTAALPAPGFTGTLLVVTSKNYAVDDQTALQSTFTTTSGALAADMLLVNVTRGNSRAFAQRIVSGGNWQISQPLAPWPNDRSIPAPTEVDTWADGDTIHGYALTKVGIACLGGVTSGAFESPNLNLSHIAYQLDLFSPSGVGFENLSVEGTIASGVIECSVQRFFAVGANTNSVGCRAFNVAFRTDLGMICERSSGLQTMTISGGYLQGPFQLANCVQDSDTIIGVAGEFTECSVADIFVDTAASLQMRGYTQVGNGRFYGPGFLTTIGTIDYRAAASATVCFLLTGGIQIGGHTKAYSNATTAGVVAVHQPASLNPSLLDAAAGGAGYGGLAYIPGVGAYWNGATTP